MDWLRKAAELNSHGASLVGSRNVKLALEYFRSSLDIVSLLAQGFTYCGQEPGAYGPTSNSSQSQLSLDLPSVSSFSSAANQNEKPKARGDLEEAHQYLFLKALTFTADIDDLSAEILSFCTAVVEFNIALSFHMLSRRWGERCLCKAVRVYDDCLAQLRRSACGLEACNTVLFAALNNKAAIYYEMSYFERARDTLGCLLDAINKSRKQGSLAPVEDEALEGFLFNILLLQGACIAPAA